MWDVVPVPVARGAMAGAAPPGILVMEAMVVAQETEMQALVAAVVVALGAALL
jgi:hypothetical protein